MSFGSNGASFSTVLGALLGVSKESSLLGAINRAPKTVENEAPLLPKYIFYSFLGPQKTVENVFW